MEYFGFLRECLGCLAEHPDRTNHQILETLSKLAGIMNNDEGEDSRQLEYVKCCLTRDLLQKRPYAGEKRIDCGNLLNSEPVDLSSFLAYSMNPLIEFFDEVDVLSLNPLHVGSTDEETASALGDFFSRLRALEKLKEVHIAFPSVQAFSRAVDMGLSQLSFVNLSVEIRSFSSNDFDILAVALTKGIKCEKLSLIEDFLFSSGRSIDETLAFIAGKNSFQVTSSTFSPG